MVYRIRYHYPPGHPLPNGYPVPANITMNAQADTTWVPLQTGYWCRDCDHFTQDKDHFGACCKGVQNTQLIVCPNCETIHSRWTAVDHLKKCYGGRI